MSFIKITLPILFVIFLSPAWASACDSKDTTDIINIFSHSIELNDQFKQSVNTGDEVRYKTLRKQVEQYDEQMAMPCVRRVQTILKKHSERVLIHKLMEFTISHENSADETTSTAMATVFAMHHKEFKKEWENFTLEQKKILLSSIETGWFSVEKSLSIVQRRNLEGNLRLLRKSVSSSPAIPQAGEEAVKLK